jgi:hypothetical protein
MANKIPVDTLYYVTIVTKDAKALARNHSDFYGIPEWKVVHHTPERLKNTTFRGRVRTAPPPLNLSGPNPAPGEFGFTSAIGSSQKNGVTFQIVQPTGGLSTFEQFLVTRGQGVHGLFLSVVQPKEFEGLKKWLASEGIAIAQSFSIDDAADYYYFDTREKLGGWYLQMVVPRVADWNANIKTDEVWNFSKDSNRPKPIEVTTKVEGITHFGVIIPDVEKYVANFAHFFDQPLWRGMNWRTEPGSLEETTCNGKPVTHAYFTGRADVGKTPGGVNFGFEIVQPTFGPSHYKENFLQILGPGIHHIDLQMPMDDWEEWRALNGWLATDFGAPCCMSGKLRGGQSLFQYQDTRQKLGYVIEIHAPRDPSAPRQRWAPDYWYDFTGQTNA